MSETNMQQEENQTFVGVINNHELSGCSVNMENNENAANNSEHLVVDSWYEDTVKPNIRAVADSQINFEVVLDTQNSAVNTPPIPTNQQQNPPTLPVINTLSLPDSP